MARPLADGTRACLTVLIVRRQLLLVAMALSFVIGGHAPAYACTCAAHSPQETANSADVVFTGVVRSVSGGVPYGVSCTPGSSVAVRFDVETVYKGDIGPTVSLLAVGGSGGSCGYTFVRDRRYTVFPLFVAGKLDAGICRPHVEGPIAAADYGLPAGRPPRN